MKIGKRASYHLYRSCLSKLSYVSEAEAGAVLTDMLINPITPDRQAGRRMHVYQCDFAPHYHIGHVGRPPPID